MSWETKKKDIKECFNIAESNIVVYKIGRAFCSSGFTSWHDERFAYHEKELLPSINLEPLKKYGDIIVINEGYHSYSADCLYQCKEQHLSIYNRKDFPFGLADYCDDNNFIVNVGEFIIPKGTEYYKNENGEIVSSTIMWDGKDVLYDELRSCEFFSDIYFPN